MIGIGDMAGDVFGNGMLLLKYICLLVVFNYIYIFIDLILDFVSSWEECNCLFNLFCLSWEDYNLKLIFKGGGVFLCKVKVIMLMFEM